MNRYPKEKMWMLRERKKKKKTPEKEQAGKRRHQREQRCGKQGNKMFEQKYQISQKHLEEL